METLFNFSSRMMCQNSPSVTILLLLPNKTLRIEMAMGLGTISRMGSHVAATAQKKTDFSVDVLSRVSCAKYFSHL